MSKFEELDKRKTSTVEHELLEKWEKEDLLQQTIDNRKDSEDFVFYDGPATANGMPGVHHMLAKLSKDVFCKYKTMKGYRVLRKVGWDTHGLPVEVQVKQLQFSWAFNHDLPIVKIILKNDLDTFVNRFDHRANYTLRAMRSDDLGFFAVEQTQKPVSDEHVVFPPLFAIEHVFAWLVVYKPVSNFHIQLHFTRLTI